MEAPGTLLFHRDFQGLTGGHLKVWHYFQHAAHSRRFQRRIHLTPRSIRDQRNPWHQTAAPVLSTWMPEAADRLFLAGLDWQAVPEETTVPVINLIQGVRHADPADPRRAFLARPATRICVSQEVADAILATGLVNGPVHVIPNGIDPAELPRAAPRRDIKVLIAGAKNPAFAAALLEPLKAAGIRPECLLEAMPRGDFLHFLARAEVVVTLPLEREGFFLPALEAMAAGALVVCPDCVGNRGFCRDRETAFRPPFSVEAVAEAVMAAVALDPARSAAMRQAAGDEVLCHSLDGERAAFLRILDAG
jgi:glycosyltransferase involved in cell wall biosynthesis